MIAMLFHAPPHFFKVVHTPSWQCTPLHGRPRSFSPFHTSSCVVCYRLGMDATVIEAARGRLDTGASAADAAIAQLEVLRERSERAETALWAAKVGAA
eukprot:350159-Chlamydomonas_euryale.AAC.3